MNQSSRILSSLLRPRSIAALGALLLSLSAASAIHARSINLVVKAEGSALKLSGPTGAVVSEISVTEPSDLVLVCSGISCSELAVTVVNDSGTPQALSAADNASAETSTFALKPAMLSGKTRLQFRHGNGVTAVQGDLAVIGGANSKPAGVNEPDGTLCNGDVDELEAYSADSDRATVVVRADGTLLTTMPKNFDEDDELVVWVVAPADKIEDIKVRRSSEFRKNSPRFVGEGIDLGRFMEYSGGKTRCERKATSLANFEPGKGEVEISTLEDGRRKILGTFEFRVNPLYSGLFHFGGAWSRVQDPAFRLQSNAAGERIVSAGEIHNRRLVYALFYTPFVWGKQDVEKGFEHWYQRINPTVGLSVEDTFDNAFLGASYVTEMGFVLTLGAHVGHVEVLDPKAGIAVGDVVDASEAPTAKDWQAGGFLSVSVDLRAATSFLSSLVSKD